MGVQQESLNLALEGVQRQVGRSGGGKAGARAGGS